jgi:1-acylglycerol-3-phosphate O-acyltransferase
LTSGSGIAPFTPIKTPSTTLWALLHTALFLFRLPFFATYVLFYFAVLHHLPLPVAAHKILIGFIMGIPGIWWVDLQLDGVKRGHLAEQPASRVPHPGSVIAASFTSPIDALYLAAIFDPVFTVSYPGSRKVKRVGLLTAVWMALSPAQLQDVPANHKSKDLVDLGVLLKKYPDRVIAVFPECGTTNGKGILPFSPSLLTVPAETPIFPVSLRYAPPDITTPVPGAYFTFLWNLLSRPTHSLRVRIAESVTNTSLAPNGVSTATTTGADAGDAEDDDDEVTLGENEGVSFEEQRVLDRVGEALARLGRNKRVGLTLRDKAAFVQAWQRG